MLACSALKQAYRDRLAAAAKAPGDVRFVYLKGDYDTIAARLAARPSLHAGALLESQFATLEEPPDAIVVDVGEPIADEIAQDPRRARTRHATT